MLTIPAPGCLYFWEKASRFLWVHLDFRVENLEHGGPTRYSGIIELRLSSRH
jgi:hypothetical protein